MFKEFLSEVQKQFDKMCETGKLFKSTIKGEQVWDIYISKDFLLNTTRYLEAKLNKLYYC